MPALIALLITVALAVAVSFGICGIHKNIEGYWPRWHFRLFLAWWWPFRSESAATLAALAIDADPEAWKIDSTGPYRGRTLASDALKARVSEGWMDSRVSLSVAGKDVPLSVWDHHCLATAFDDWMDRKNEVDRTAATVEAATTFSTVFREKYGRTQ